MACNIVVEWLRSLQLQQYADSFLDNGYDDLEICKQVGDPDLDAIGVLNPQHRLVLLQSVRSLREEGAASVYFTLEPKDEELVETPNESSSPLEGPSTIGAVGPERSYADEYEEGKAELVRIPKLQLKLLLREKLTQDGVRLSFQPYSTPNGERGYLEGLASRYADRFNTHYQDVLEYLEELRKQEWDDLSPRMRVVTSTVSTPGTPPFPGPLLLAQQGPGGLYAPGKYSTSGVQPSSCLSDKEEDEIYGFGYGVYGRQMYQRQQQMAQTAAPIYQSCLSPRSAYFYEFPPGDQASSSKKKTTFSRLLRTLRPLRKEKHSSVSPTNNRQQARSILPPCAGAAGAGAAVTISSRVSTPDEPVPPDYDHIRLLQVNPRGQPICGVVSPGGFEETIQRLKMQDAIKKKEKFHKEQEEILRDIRHGLMQIGLDAAPNAAPAAIPRYPSMSDDTYMYDDDLQQQQHQQLKQQQQKQQKRPPRSLHWYDEPPYESDPEDFLMGGLAANRTVFQNGRVCFTLNLKQEPRGEGVISLRSAGDISIPKEASWRRGARPKRNHNRESGDYAASDVHSVGSRLSTISVETNRSMELDPKARSHSSEETQSPTGPSDSEEGSKASRSMRHDKKRLRAESTDKENRSVNFEHQRQLNHKGRHQDYPPSIGKARALVDCIPSPYDKESLRFKKGDIIDIISMNVSGNWKGYVHGRIGTFKFINVELISAAPGPIGPVAPSRKAYTLGRLHRRGRPKNIEDLLHRVNLEDYVSLFVMNGYEDLEIFKELEEVDLNYLGIRNPEARAKILAAVGILLEYDSPSESGDEASSSDSSVRHSGKVPFKRLDMGRDSGCYASCNEQGAMAAAEKGTPEPEKRPLEAPRSANASPRLRSASAAVASALAAASMAAAQSKERQQQVPRTPSYDFRAEYDKLKGKLEASLTKMPLAADGQKLAESAVAAGIRCFSEKSSDSGVSSSSRSPPPAQTLPAPSEAATPAASPKPE